MANTILTTLPHFDPLGTILYVFYPIVKLFFYFFSSFQITKKPRLKKRGSIQSGGLTLSLRIWFDLPADILAAGYIHPKPYVFGDVILAELDIKNPIQESMVFTIGVYPSVFSRLALPGGGQLQILHDRLPVIRADPIDPEAGRVQKSLQGKPVVKPTFPNIQTAARGVPS